MSWFWGITGLLAFVVLLMSTIKIYKAIRLRNTKVADEQPRK
jgi:hypothetical protein